MCIRDSPNPNPNPNPNQDMHQLFAASPAALAAVDWSALGAARGGEHSSLWLGSEGSHTPTHFDTYGVNLVCPARTS